MINRYHGNSGKVTRIEERPRVQREHSPPLQPPEKESPKPRQGGKNPALRHSGVPGIQNILGQLGKILPGGLGKPGAMDTEDIILLLILYLMYRESGDNELLMMMGAMFLL